MTELPQEVQNYFDKAKLAMDKDNHEYAIELLLQALSLKQDFAQARRMLRQAEKKLIEKDPLNAVDKLTNKISSVFALLKGSILEKQKKYSEAMDVYEDMLRQNPLNNSILLHLADLLLRAGYQESALGALEDSLEVDSDNLVALKIAGKLYAQTGNYEKAKTCYQKLLKINPKNQSAIKGLKNIDALGTIRDKFSGSDETDLSVR